MDVNRVIDWDVIKSEYYSNSMTLRQLALKYGVSAPAICKRAKKEHWQKEIDEIEKSVNERIKESVVNAKMTNNERALRMSQDLLIKIDEAIQVVKPKDVGALKGLVASMQGLKEMGVYQLASEDNNIKVEISSDLDDYAN